MITCTPHFDKVAVLLEIGRNRTNTCNRHFAAQLFRNRGKGAVMMAIGHDSA